MHRIGNQKDNPEKLSKKLSKSCCCFTVEELEFYF